MLNQRKSLNCDCCILNLVRQHLRQPDKNTPTFNEEQQILTRLKQVFDRLGAIFVTSEGEVQFMTQRGEQLLSQYFSPYASRSLPESLQHWFEHQISLLTSQEKVPSPCFPLHIEQAEKQLNVRLICDSIGKPYLLLLEEQELQSFSISSLELLGLTKREAEVLFWVAQDKSNAAIAKVLGYNGFGNNGSVRDYFYDNSRGKLNYTNVVTQYYTAAHNRSYYTDPAISYGTRARELIVEALNHLKSQGFNFSQLSSDSNGFIYALNVFYAGARVNNWGEGLWPHSWVLASEYDVGGGKKFRDYQITNMGSELTLRTFCHENGHMICDFPDLYDYGGESAGVGHYCLMCYGANNTNPAQVCAYLKNEAGWATKVTSITPGITASLPAANNDFYVYAKNETEYFIIENRQKTGRDTFLPDAGLAIWHVDEGGSNNNEQMTASKHYECSLEQADGRFDLEKNANAGDSADLFRASYKTEFSDSTSPSSKWWDGSNSSLKIAQISASGATMTFVTPGAVLWLENKQITGLWSINQERNAYAYVGGVGWRKISAESDSIFLGMLELLSSAKASKSPVNLRVENDAIKEVYVF